MIQFGILVLFFPIGYSQTNDKRKIGPVRKKTHALISDLYIDFMACKYSRSIVLNIYRWFVYLKAAINL